MEDLSGRSFGVYRIVEPLGAGGMAAVYKAYQPSVDRHVALKILPRHLAQDAEFLGRFKQEAKVLAHLQHPHILPVHDFGETDGFTYIVMPFIKTGTLAMALQGRPLPFQQIKRVMVQVGDALDCAHAQGVVHRDVKPSNILLDERGHCLLADFGIAKMLEAHTSLTATGGLVGTPKYMSPEQGTGEALDGRSDIYSLGVVLYEMATGRTPFNAETPVGIVVKHIHDPLPIPRQINPDIPDDLERVIFRAMHKEPSERFRTAGAMVDAMASASATPNLAAGLPPDTGNTTASLTVAGTTGAPASLHSNSMDAEAPTTPATRQRRLAGIVTASCMVIALLFFVWGEVSEPEVDRAPAPSRAENNSLPTNTVSPLVQPRRAEGNVLETATPESTAEQVPLEAETAGLGAPSSTPPAPVSTVSEEVPPFTPPLDTAPSANGNLLLSVDTPSVIAIDGNVIESLAPGETRIVTLPLGEHLIVATAHDGVTRAQTIVDLDSNGQQVVAFDLADQVARRNAMTLRDPFPDQGDGTFLDRQTGQHWTIESASPTPATGYLWSDANTHCARLRLANGEWRLPTQPELDSILQRLDPERYRWGLTLWSADRPFGESNRLWVRNSAVYAPQWSTAVRNGQARRLTHHTVCIADL
jgi:serine/threonine protein kinase